MRKTVLSLIAAGLVGAVMVPAAHAITPRAANGQNEMTGMQTGQTLKQQQAQLRRDRMMLKRDVRLGKTSEARKMRREINADQRAIRQAKGGMQEGTSAKSMQPQQPMMPPQSQPNNTTDNSNNTRQNQPNNQ
jgi:hypothetical protein